MYRFIARRLGSGVVLIAALATLTFFLLYLGAGDRIARQLLGEDADDAAVRAKEHELGLDRPIWTQFGHWASGAVHGDLGTSWFNGQDVRTAILSRLSVTVTLVIGSTLLTVVLATVLGVVAATRGGWVDRVVQFLGVLGHAVPNFLISLGLVTLFAISLHWFRPTGYVRFADSPQLWLSSITLPVLALTINGVSGVVQQVRGSVLDELGRDYVRTLRSRGLPESRVVYRHVLRNAAGPALSFLGVQVVGLLGGAVIIEQVFAIPGLGQVAVTATGQGDIPLVMGLVVVSAVLVVLVNLLVDLVQGWLNPKVRLG
ncbi:ABC transporter permease subunit [Actinomadura rayongensis]|uniref:ABC transporter permease subunit n=1 Tax=Actinomadura rayongensis TaxID=1429076 RepID=A0A6I4WBW4_9ACTN|nr:ABC transporter permease subunit [Actinomadura rayongensis]